MFSQPDHSGQGVAQRRVEPTRLGQQREHVAVRLRLSEAIVGDDVRSHVQRALNGDLQRVLDEAALQQIDDQPGRLGQALQIGERRFDCGQLLRDERRIGHDRLSRGRR